MTEPGIRRVPDADLGSIFGNRTEGLGGLAPRRARPAPAPVDPLPPDPEPASPWDAGEAPIETPTSEVPPSQVTKTQTGGGRSSAATAAKATGPSRGAGAPAAITSSPMPRLVILQLPNGVADQLRDHARQRGVTYKELTLDAVEATADQLTELLAAQRPQARSIGLFAGERVAAQARPQGRRQVSIKLTESSISALDDLADKYGARSRSELVATALSAYLAG